MSAGAILRKTKALSQSKTFQHSLVLVSGKAGIHLVALLSQPLLARLYSPGQFGEFAFFNSIMSIIFIASSGRYEAGIVITKKPEQAKGLFQLSQFILIIYAVIILGFSFSAPENFQGWLLEKGVTPFYFWSIPAMIIFTGYWQIVNNWLIRFQKFSLISLTLLAQRMAILLAALAAYHFSIPGNGLIFSLLIGFGVIFIISVFVKPPSFKFSYRNIMRYASHFKDFPAFSVPTLYLNLLVTHLPVLWITFFYNLENAGAFSLAYSFILVPVQFIHISLGQIFYQKLAQTQKSLRFNLLIKFCKIFTFFLFPAVLVVAFFGEKICYFFLGENWNETGKIFSTMALLMLIHGLSGLFIYVINVSRRQQLNLIVQAIQLVFLVIAFSIGLYFHNIYLSIKLLVFFSTLNLIFTVHKVLKFIDSPTNTYKGRKIAAN